MKLFFCITLLLLGVSIVRSIGFDKALQFPRDVSLKNHVLLNPDFSDAQNEISICGWVKHFYGDARFDGNRYWFSYRSHENVDEINFANRVSNQHFLDATIYGLEYYTPSSMINTWHHNCWTWSSGSQLGELYNDGTKEAETIIASGSKLSSNGTLVLGQKQKIGDDVYIDTFGVRRSSQPTVGGFGGEIYQLQILKRKLTGKEVEELYRAGICGYTGPSQDTLLDWEDFLGSKRYGEVKEVSVGCNRWDVLQDFVGQEITPSLIAYLKRHHKF